MLDARLWTWRDDAFLPHGTAAMGHAARQPIWLTCGDENPNGAQLLMLVAGARAVPAEAAAFERVCLLFEAADAEALAAARDDWRAVTAAGLPARYWAQEAGAGWRRRAPDDRPAERNLCGGRRSVRHAPRGEPRLERRPHRARASPAGIVDHGTRLAEVDRAEGELHRPDRGRAHRQRPDPRGGEAPPPRPAGRHPRRRTRAASRAPRRGRRCGRGSSGSRR
jgi:DNA polymerase IIIc chi subunit